MLPGLGVRVGQPRVEREHRHLDEEGQRERAEQPDLQVLRVEDALQLEVVERERAAVQPPVRVRDVQDRAEHQDGAEERVEEELERRLDAVRASPDPDHHVHRDEHQLPEDVEEEEVHRDERAHHRALEQEQREAPVLQPRLERPERRVRRDRHDDAGEQQQPERDPVDRDVIANAELRHPRDVLVEVEPAPHRHAEQERARAERREHDAERDPAEEAGGLAREEEDRDRAGDREPDQPREERGRLVGRMLDVREDAGLGGPHPDDEQGQERGDRGQDRARRPVVLPRHERRDGSGDGERDEIGRDLGDGCRGDPEEPQDDDLSPADMQRSRRQRGFGRLFVRSGGHQFSPSCIGFTLAARVIGIAAELLNPNALVASTRTF